MSQLGMHMPGGSRRASSLNVYTGLLFLAVVSLATASVLVDLMVWLSLALTLISSADYFLKMRRLVNEPG